MSKKIVKKAVFPVAGFGTRMLPATKSIPKEMLPVVDKPLVQYAVEEALAAGLEEIIFVTGRGKQAIEDHFDHAYELEAALKSKGKQAALDSIITPLLTEGRVKYVRQMQPNGLGHAVLCAEDLIGDEPFVVISTDDLILGDANYSAIGELIEAYEENNANILGVIDVPRAETNKYGILDIDEDDGKIAKVKGLVEKPDPKDAPSNLSIVGRYVLNSEIFKYLRKQEKDKSGEIQLTDAMAAMLAEQEFLGVRFIGKRFDCGNKLGWLEANIAAAINDPNLKEDMNSILDQYKIQNNSL